MAQQKIGIEFTGDASSIIAAAKQVDKALAAVEQSMVDVGTKVKASADNMKAALATSAAGMGKSLGGLGKEFNRVGQEVQKASQLHFQASSDTFSHHARSIEANTSAFSGLRTALSSSAASMVGWGAAIGGSVLALRELIGSAIQLQTAMANVNTLLDRGSPPIERWTDAISALSTRSTKDVTDLAAGLYDAISAGVPATMGAGGAMEFLDAAQKAATAGMATTKDTVNAFTTILNTYGKKAGSITEISDAFFQTIKDGVVTMPLMAGGIGEVAAIADVAGVEFKTMMAAIAEVSKIFPNKSTTFVAVRNAIQSLAAPTLEVSKRFDQLGVKVGGAEIKARGFEAVLQDVVTATGGNLELLRQVIPEVDALSAAIQLAKNEGKDFAEAIEKQNGALGSTQVAWDKAVAALSAKWSMFWNGVQAGIRPVTTELLKAADDVLGIFNAIGGALKKLDEQYQRARDSAAQFWDQLTRGTPKGPVTQATGYSYGVDQSTMDEWEKADVARRVREAAAAKRAAAEYAAGGASMLGDIETPGSVGSAGESVLADALRGPVGGVQRDLEMEKEFGRENPTWTRNRRTGEWTQKKPKGAARKRAKRGGAFTSVGQEEFGPPSPEAPYGPPSPGAYVAGFDTAPEITPTAPRQFEATSMYDVQAAMEDRIAAGEEEMEPFVEMVGMAADGLRAFGSALYEIAGAAIGYAGRGAEGIDALQADLTGALLFVDNVVKYLPKIFDAVTARIPQLAIAVGNAIPVVAAMLAEKMPLVVKALMGQLPRIVDALIAATPDLVQAVVASLPYLVESLIYVTISRLPKLISTVIGQVVPAIINQIPAIVAAIARGVYEALKEVLDKLNPVGGGFDKINPISEDSIFNAFGMVSLGKGIVDNDLMPWNWNQGGMVGELRRFANGGMANAMRPPDLVPAALQSGEFVVRRDAAGRNKEALTALNAGGQLGGGSVNVNIGARFGSRDLGALLSRLLVVEVQRAGVPVRSIGEVASQRVRNYPTAQPYIPR